MGNTNINIPESNLTKISYQDKNDQIQYICMEMKGWRKQMQDAAIHQLNIDKNQNQQQYSNSLFAVFDGHGTSYISRFLKENFIEILINLESYKQLKYVDALEQTFKILDQMIISQTGQKKLKIIKEEQDKIGQQSKSHPTGQKIGYLCGSTANVVLITKQHYYIANCGDSRSVLCRDGYAIKLSRDHKPTDEKQIQRIQKAKGFVENGRVNQVLAVSRAFGDFQFKKNKNLPYDQQIVTCKPQIQVYGRSERDQFILIACDGIWQNFPSSKPVVDLIINDKFYKKNQYFQVVVHLLNRLIAKNQKQELGMDNMTVLFLKFNNQLSIERKSDNKRISN